MKILIVEDEKKTAAYLCKGLGENGFVVDIASQGENGFHLARTGEYDLLILDIMLPERDGWSVIAELRRMGKETPVLFLTARDAVQDRIKELEPRADDYLIKPFAFSELLARVRSILRRGPSRQLETLRIGDLELDLLRRRTTRGGQRLDLTPKEFLLLSLLARRSGEVLSRILIATRIYVAVANDFLFPPCTRAFLRENYLPVGRLRVAGRLLTLSASNGLSSFPFDVQILAQYAIGTERGTAVGWLDGAPYESARFLTPGRHEFRPSAGADRFAVVWAQAVERGFSPFPPQSESP